jgi:hypothetical protein
MRRTIPPWPVTDFWSKWCAQSCAPVSAAMSQALTAPCRQACAATLDGIADAEVLADFAHIEGFAPKAKAAVNPRAET